jgi:hypothetical protein
VEFARDMGTEAMRVIETGRCHAFKGLEGEYCTQCNFPTPHEAPAEWRYIIGSATGENRRDGYWIDSVFRFVCGWRCEGGETGDR